jgi:hypothetical protein
MAEDAETVEGECWKQDDALWELHDELDSMLHAQQLRGETVDSGAVVRWLRLLHNIVQDGLQRPRYPFPEG